MSEKSFSTSVRSFSKKLWEAVIVTKCPSCSALTKHSGTFCGECLDKYASEKESKCGYCDQIAAECVCSNRDLVFCREFGKSMYSYSFYTPDNTVLGKSLYMLKRSPDRNVEKLFARELAAELLRMAREKGIDLSEWCVTFPPRGRSSLANYGFDQSKGLAKRISHLTGAKYESVFVRHGSARQKSLDAPGRKQNAKAAFSLRRKASVKGKKYVIVDDVITTGATVSACEKLLLSNGASSVFVISIAKTPKRGKGYDREEKRRSKPKNDDLWFFE